MHYTLSQAAKETGKSKGTISKYLHNGTLSYVEKTKEGYKIDASELFRVFPKREPRTHQNERLATHEKPLKTLELELENKQLKQALAKAEMRMDELKEDKAFLQGELSKTTTLLSDKTENRTEKHAQSRKRLFGIIPI